MQLSNVCGFIFTSMFEPSTTELEPDTRPPRSNMPHIVKSEFYIADPRCVRQKNLSSKMCNMQNNSVSHYAL